MDRQGVVRELTKRGVLVTPEMLEGGGLEALHKHAPIQTHAPKKALPKLSVKIRRAERLPQMSVEDFGSYYNARYAGLRDMILKRMPALSINKAREGFSDVSVVGMVKEKGPGGFVLEDTTGEIFVVSGDDVAGDDVVGVRGVIKEGRMFQKELMWPDVPANNVRKAVPGVLLLSTFMDDIIRGVAGDFTLMFIPEEPNIEIADDEKRKLITRLPNPCAASINTEGSTFSLLIYTPTREVSLDDVVGFLKRRHLSPDKREISTKTDPYLIEPVPDLFWVISGERRVERYRGVTIIMTRKHDAVKYDTGTGEVSFAYNNPPPQTPHASS